MAKSLEILINMRHPEAALFKQVLQESVWKGQRVLRIKADGQIFTEKGTRSVCRSYEALHLAKIALARETSRPYGSGPAILCVLCED